MLRRVGIGVVAVLVVVMVGAAITALTVSRRPLPDASGEYRINGLDGEVQVLRDDLGIPQIYASTSHDLFLTQGYVHAQDRFFEMDFRRHVTAGRLSELVGEAGLDVDRTIRTLGWRHVAEQELPLLSPETREYLQAYADGVNAYIGSREPGQLAMEYSVLGLQVDVPDIEPWTSVDSLAWLKAMAWDLLGNYDEELGRAAVYGQAQGYGGDVALDMVNAIYPGYPTERNLPVLTTPELLESNAELEASEGATGADGTDASGASGPGGLGDGAGVEQALADVSAALDAVPALLGEGDGLGSNSWVVSGEHTSSGLPLLANDPHLGISQPGIWYQNGLHCTTVGTECPFDVAGFSFAGLPGVVIGHNADLGWGFTNMYSDAVDLFLERVYPDGTYLVDGERVPLTEREEVISVNGGADVTISVRSTGHGPIVSDVLAASRGATGGPPQENQPPAGVSGFSVAMQWTALTPGRTADAIFMLDTASTPEDVAAAAASFEVPSQNIVFATTSGDIGYQAPGKVPLRADVTDGPVPSDGSWPRPGWDSRYDWQGFVDAADMPSVLNPEEGFVVAANQAVEAPGEEPFLSRDFDYGYRSQAIRDALEGLIADGVEMTAQHMTDIQLIDVNPYAEMLVPVLRQVAIEGDSPQEIAFTQGAVDLLDDWDYRNDADSAAAAYFAAVWTNLLRLTFWDQVPADQRPSGGSRWLEAVRSLLEEEDSPWWDDRATLTQVEQRDQILAEALSAARTQLTVLLGKDPSDWRWGALHQAAPQHEVLGGEASPGVIRTIVNPDPIEVAGGSSIVNANGWDASAWQDLDGEPTYPIFTVTAVPSMRMVLDASDWDASTWVQLTGNSGHPLSPHYSDQFRSWADGETYPWAFSVEAVDAATVDTLTLSPPG